MVAVAPERGDLVWLEFSPQAGHEQAGRRPALVVSPAPYNSRSGLALVCPVTTKSKGYPFDVNLPEGLPVWGVIQSDQLRSLDWKERTASFIARVSEDTLQSVLDKLRPLLGL